MGSDRQRENTPTVYDDQGKRPAIPRIPKVLSEPFQAKR